MVKQKLITTADKIRSAMEDAGITVSPTILSRLTGASRVNCSRWLNGHQIPSMPYLKILARILKVSVEDLLA